MLKFGFGEFLISLNLRNFVAIKLRVCVSLRQIYIKFDQIYPPGLLASRFLLGLVAPNFVLNCIAKFNPNRRLSSKKILATLLHLRTKRAFYVKALAGNFYIVWDRACWGGSVLFGG